MSTRIKVFHNILWSKYKGAVLSELHAQATASGCDIAFVQIAETEDARVSLGAPDLSYHRYPCELLFQGSYDAIPRITLMRKLFWAAWSTNEDLVVLPGYYKPEFWVMLLACVLKRQKRAVFCDSTTYDKPRTSALRNFAKRLFFSLCHGYFCYGTRSKEYLIGLGAAPRRVYERCQAAALEHTYSEQAALENRVRLRQEAGFAPAYLYVGRLSEEKDLGTLLKAMKIVCEQQANARLTIIGAGPLRDQIKSQVAAEGLLEKVDMPGAKDIAELAVAYGRATCLVLPSISEPWGLVVNEALAHGCPTVASDICGCVPELIKAGVTGYTFEPRNELALAECMLRAHKELNNAGKTANDCFNTIRQYSPQSAAGEILKGCLEILEVAPVKPALP